jgi:catechol 2,3-dioxygenase-like lactoylglutathione lyase family enzyme
MRRIAFDHFAIAVSNRAETFDFYQRVLCAELVDLAPGRYAFRWGRNQINVRGPNPHLSPTEPILPGSADVCFAWEGTVEEAAAYLGELGVPLIAGPMARHGAGGNGRSVYFRDPEGNLLEFISYR